MPDFLLKIASVADRENLVAEIWFDNNLIAEVNQETKEMLVELYLGDSNLLLPLDDFLLILQKAKEKLLQK